MGSKQTDFARSSRRLFVPQASTMVAARIRYEEGSYEGEVNEAKNPEGQGTFEYRGDDEAARLMYDGGWKDKAADGYGVMKWQNGDRYEGDWVAGLREGKGKYLSKPTGGKYEGEYVADLKEGSGKIHVCQRGHLRRAVEGGTETRTGDVHLEGEERKVLWGLGGWGEAGSGQVHLPQWRCLHWPLRGRQSPWAWRAGQGRWGGEI